MNFFVYKLSKKKVLASVQQQFFLCNFNEMLSVLIERKKN